MYRKAHLHCMVQVTQIRFFPLMWHRSDMTGECVKRKKKQNAWIPIFSDRIQASLIQYVVINQI